MKPIVRRIATSKALWVIVALVVVYALLGYLLAPYLIERSVPRYVEDNLGIPATIGKVRVNPFLFKVEANDFRAGPDAAQPVAAFNRLFVDLELVSVLRWAWTFAEFELDGLQVNGRIERSGHFNLAELADHWSKAHPSEPGQKPPRTIVRHLALRGAAVSFTDLSQPKPASAKSDAIDLEVDELATVPDLEGRYAFSARLPGGGTLSWQGDVSLQPIASKGEWHMKGLRLATVWQFFRDHMNLAEPRGNLSVAGRYDFSYENGAARLAMQGLNAQIAALSIAREGEKRPLLALETIVADEARYDLAKNEVVVPRLRFANGNVSATALEQGTLDWQMLLKEKPHAKDPEKKSAASPFHARVDAITIDNVGLRYTDRTRTAPLDYAAGLRGSVKLDIAASDATHITGSNVRLVLTDASVKTADSDGALASLQSIAVEGGQFDTAARTVSIDTLAVKGGSSTLTRSAKGNIALIDAFTPGRASKEQPVENAKPAEKQWKYAVHAVDASGLRVAFADESYKPVLRYDVELTSAALKNIAADGKGPIEVNAALRAAQGGTINGNGTLAQDFKQANLKVEASGISAEPLRPLLAHYTILDLKTGNASASARVDYRNGGKPALRVEGNAKVANLLVNEADTGDRFVSWKMLNAESVALTMSPNRLVVKEVVIQEPGAKIVVAKDRSVNITQVMKRPGDQQESAQSEKAPSERFPVRVARVRLQQGTLDFADNSLVLPFATQVKALDGAIVGLSTYRESRAELKLDGTIVPNGTAGASGSLKPADPKSFLDINVKFDNVEMPPLSPYTATFAGRKIAAGRLWVDIDYKIVDSQLLGENRFVMADFQLGERVQSPTALDLPLDLAVALLKEPDGRIHLAVPVRGDVNNPKFDYGELIRDAIGNTLKRIVTAPFRFLAGVLGGKGGSDELQSIQFNPGSTRLMPPERERLQKVAEALKSRAQLKLLVHGAYDPERDGQAMRDLRVRRAIAQELGVKLKPDEDPGPIAYDDPDAQRAIEKFLTARAGEDAVPKFAAEYAKKTGKEPRRVNPVLAMFHRGRGDRDFYEALFGRLVQSEPLSEKELAELATRRAQAIADFVAQNGIDASRIAVGKTQTVEDHAKPLAATLALEAA